jgi:hypothetical protein
MDLLEYHLEDTEGGFEPWLTWCRPRPQVCFAIASMTIETVRNYFEYIGGGEMPETLDERLTDLFERNLIANQAHEKFVSAQGNVELA